MDDADDIMKTREIHLSPARPEQLQMVCAYLNCLDGVKAQLAQGHVVASYSIMQHSLEEMEELLLKRDVMLDDSILHKIQRKLIYHLEEVQQENLRIPDRNNRNREIFVKVYEHHLHGDHDDTPEEWREYR